MRRTSIAGPGRLWLVIIAVFIGWLLISPTAAQATCTTNQGNNAAYGTCAGSTPAPQGSPAYIDASVVTPGTDFCNTLFNIINSAPGYPAYPTSGAVIDARGISAPVPCASGSTPWISGSTAPATNYPATILLPAATITISNTWILPQHSRIVGQGPGLTTITPATGFNYDPAEDTQIDALIEMGTQSTALAAFCGGNADCVEVGVQDLTLNLNGGVVSVPYGIYNAASQELSYVDNVIFNAVGNSTTATYALEVTVVSGPSSSNSGPYTNLVCNLGTSVNAGTRCVDLQAHTRGLHGITCNGGSNSATAAIYLDSDANSIEDVYINGFLNGIYIGSQAGLSSHPQAPSNVLFNIAGGSSVTNLIHISNNTTASSTPICPGGTPRQAVCDLTILNASAAANTTILDDLTPPALTVTGGDTNVGVYIVGEQIGSTATSPLQYTRFTSSPRVPTWGSGTSRPSGTCTSTGSLYSSVSTGTGGNLFACIGSWTKIP